MSRKLILNIGFFSICTFAAMSAYPQAQNQHKKKEDKNVFTCHYESEYKPVGPSKVIYLTESPQTIEFTDIIAEDHGGSTLIEGHIIEKGKAILIKIETGMQYKAGRSNITTQLHYIDSSLLPRNIPVDGILLKGAIIVERSAP